VLRACCILLTTIYTAQAQTPGTRIGDVELKPYLLQQLDEGGTFDQSRGGGEGTGFNLRRSRVGVQVDIAHQVELGVIWDFGGTPGNKSRLFEADIAYVGLAPFVFRAGVFKPSFTLEYAQSAADVLFLERATIVNIVGGLVAGPGRVGGQVGATGDRWFAAAWLTGGQTGHGANSEQRAVLGRAAVLAVKTDAVSVHLGASGAWLYHPPHPGDGGESLSFSGQPELQIDDVDASLSTGRIAARGARMGGVEAGLGWGRLWAQGELYGIDVQRPGGDRSGLLSGYYVQTAYTLVGTPRAWKSDTASWGSPGPANPFDPRHGAWGALEIAARFSAADLNAGDIHGGRQAVWTTGLSWYPAKPLRFMLEYQHADISGGTAPRSLSAVALRGQLRF
jgi:phosphate-selective porin OprO/OprP